MSEPKWLNRLRGALGTKEVPGPKANPLIVEMFDTVGSDITSDEEAWCAAATGWALEKEGYPSTRNLAARSYLRYGKKVKPKLGAIMVFKRGSSTWQGHVGFYVGEDADSYMILGGNQGNTVSIKPYPKSSFLAARWPDTARNSNTVKAAVLGTGGTALGFIGDMAQEALPLAQEATDWIDVAKYACFGLGIVMFIVIMWRRYQKMKAG